MFRENRRPLEGIWIRDPPDGPWEDSYWRDMDKPIPGQFDCPQMRRRELDLPEGERGNNELVSTMYRFFPSPDDDESDAE